MWGKIDRIALAVFLCVAAAWIIKTKLREPAKHYTLETAFAEAHEATADMITE
jgi:hypothetical protein